MIPCFIVRKTQCCSVAVAASVLVLLTSWAGFVTNGSCAESPEVSEPAILIKIGGQDEARLGVVSAEGGVLRYVSGGVVLVETRGGSLGRFQGLFPGLVLIDTLRSGIRQWLVFPGPDGGLDSLSRYGKVTALGPEGVILIGVEETLEPRLAPFSFSMALLPDRVKPAGVLRGRVPSTLGLDAGSLLGVPPNKLAAMRYAAGAVSVDSIAATVHLVSYDDSAGAIRTRYCLRDSSMAFMADLLRQRLRQAMGGLGVDSLHAFAFRYGGVDYVLKNIVGRVSGRVPGSGKFVICAHYDDTAARTTYAEPGRFWKWWEDPAPGADDNGSGVASVLECARVLSGLQFDFDLEFVLFTAEELGLFGSRAYAQDNETMGSNIIGALNFDMQAYRPQSDTTFLRTNLSSEWFSDHIARVSEALYDSVGLGVGLVEVGSVYDASDHSSFWTHGYDAVHFFEDPRLPPSYPYYHTIYDTEEKLNYELAWKVASVGAASLAYFAQTTDPWDLEVLSGDVQFRVESSALPVTRALAGDIVTIVPSFHNVGGASPEGQAIRVGVYDGDPAAGGTLIGERLLDGPVPSGGSPVVEPFGWQLEEGDVGEHAVYIAVDAGSGEGNPANNKAWAELVVSSTTLAVRYSFVFPNPVRPQDGQGTLRFFLTKEASSVQLDVYDVSGRRVGGCKDGSCGLAPLQPGEQNEIAIQALNPDEELPPGVYAYQLKVDGGGKGKVSFGRFAIVR